ncbi:Hypothetical predicted protein [Olea europaea subsp. europaea]|uniref:Uncharacterized protein n=1 Tax=Olea europaea subsp. europaea TaxID=158383 RepID=A0A8S0VCN9_OLEEU|nr:Hypothetical predicted protein [Olea europaea subsp. europaea]
MDPPMEPNKIYVESPKDEGPSAYMSPPHVAYTADFELLKHEVIDLQKKNMELSTKIDDGREHLLSIKADSSHKRSIVVRVQENIRTDLLEIKLELKFLSNSVTAMVTISMDQILDMFKEIGENVDATIDRKAKGKMYPNVQTFDPMNLNPPSFDLGLVTPSLLRMKKINDLDNVIKSPFCNGPFVIGSKTWWHDLVSSYSSLTNMHMDFYFYYIRQLALYGENVKYKANTTNSHFQAIIKHVYPRFKKDPNVLLIDTRLVNDVTGVQLPLSYPWLEVD